jgi:hypothetical protein
LEGVLSGVAIIVGGLFETVRLSVILVSSFGGEDGGRNDTNHTQSHESKGNVPKSLSSPFLVLLVFEDFGGETSFIEGA